MIRLFIIVLISTAFTGVTHGAKPVLILGVAGTERLANDPNDPRSIAEFTHNFSEIVTLTHRREDGRGPADVANWTSDLMWSGFEDLTGRLTQHSRSALEPLRGPAREMVIAYSWGAMAVMYGIRDGVIPAPGRLVIVNPPLLSPEGTREWRAFAERFPQLALDIYIGTADVLNRMRVAEASGKYERYSPADALLPFLVPQAPARVRVRMYPGDHRLLGFMVFASRTNELGLSSRAVGGSVEIAGPRIPEFLKKDVFPSERAGLARTGGYGYLFESGPGLARAQALARVAGIGREPQTRELLRGRVERSAQDLVRARWQYATLLIATACSTPYVLEEHESRGLVPGLRIPLSDLRIGYESERRSMSNCENELFAEIIRSPRDLSIRGLAERGRRYRREHNPVRMAGQEFKKFFTSIGRAMAAPIEKLGEAASSTSAPSDSGTEQSNRERESPSREIKSEAFDQLRTGNFKWN